MDQASNENKTSNDNTRSAKHTSSGWVIIDETIPILTYEYSFGAGTATSLAVGTGSGMVVVSPPCGVNAGVFDDLLSFGPVQALIAPNAFHYLGLALWSRHFPRVPIFAPAQSVDRLKKKTRLSAIRPLSDASLLAGSHVTLDDLPHCKKGEALVRVSRETGSVWFVADIVTNMHKLPDHPIAKLLFRFTRSAPGLRFNNLAAAVMVRDKRALKRWFSQEIENTPPHLFIPSHGDAVDLKLSAQPLKAVFTT